MLETLAEFWPHLLSGAIFGADVCASAHAVLYKRDARAAIAWVGLVWLVPVVGVTLYVLLGINRIQRRAKSLRAPTQAPMALPAPTNAPPHLAGLVTLGDRLVGARLHPGNTVTVYDGGDAAYPAMWAAIEGAQHTVGLSTYIFDNDRAGARFRDTLAAAARRGVQVRVLVDGVGARYSLPPIVGSLQKAGVTAARFLPTVIPWRFPYMNLRNHRKLLVLDGRVGFTGGMNIREGHQLSLKPKHPVHDVHACFEGPVVADLVRTFADDWRFTTGEPLEGEGWEPADAGLGPVWARGIPDGPDEDLDKLRLTFLGALAEARDRVVVVSPYFLPGRALVTALNVAALRGVQVDVVIPDESNLSLVTWATRAQLWQLAEHGVNLWATPPPFDHAKLMVVDGVWSLLGSANWDPRSLRLNFEFGVECYDETLAAQVLALAEQRIAKARRVTLAELDGRPLPVRLRDGVARLFSPYL